MEKKYLIVNIGSVSKRYALYEGGKKELSKYFEKDEMDLADFDVAFEKFFDSVKEKGLVNSIEDITGIGFRVVASGTYFQEDRIINEKYLENLEKAEVKAPLHIRPLIEEIKVLKSILPNVSMVGVSDSAFHSNLPNHSYLYNIPQNDAKKGDIYRFGYHGISVQSILRKIQKEEGSVPARVIVAHLGGGASMTAVKDDKSFDTSMGTTPLEGLPMSTRVGNIGAGALIQLSKEKNMDTDQLNEYLNTKCGLLGISGKTEHVGKLFELKESGDEDASLALEMFVYNIKKYIGAYTAVLGGLDLLVFSGTISERSSSVREMVLSDLDHIGIELDKAKNSKTLGKEGYIEAETSKVKIKVVKVNELEEIALKTQNVLN